MQELTNNLVLVISVIGLLLAVLVVFYLIVSKFRKQPTPVWKQRAAERYNKLITQTTIPLKDFIMEGDKILEYVLKQKFKSPESTTGEILKKQAKYFRAAELNDIWFAHKLRNKLIHDFEFQASPSELNAAKIIYKKVLKLLVQNS